VLNGGCGWTTLRLTGQLDLAQCEKRLVVDFAACFHSIAILEIAHGFFRLRSENSVDGAGVEAFSCAS
jgi:hypothetical protein